MRKSGSAKCPIRMRRLQGSQGLRPTAQASPGNGAAISGEILKLSGHAPPGAPFAAPADARGVLSGRAASSRSTFWGGGRCASPMLPLGAQGWCAMPTEEIQYWDKGLRLRGFLAYEAAGSDRRPGVLVVHEGLGLNAHIMEQTQRVAGLGYVALAADMFGERRQARDLHEARALIGDLRAAPAKLRARGRAAVATLAALPRVDAGRLGAIGFCFGGSVVLELARDGAPLRAAVSVHGVLATTAPAVAGRVRASLLVLTGADDPLAPADQVSGFSEEMRAAKVADWQVVSYGNVLHGFTKPGADGSILPSARFDARASARAWTAMQAFLAEALDGGGDSKG